MEVLHFPRITGEFSCTMATGAGSGSYTSGKIISLK